MVCVPLSQRQDFEVIISHSVPSLPSPSALGRFHLEKFLSSSQDDLNRESICELGQGVGEAHREHIRDLTLYH